MRLIRREQHAPSVGGRLLQVSTSGPEQRVYSSAGEKILAGPAHLEESLEERSRWVLVVMIGNQQQRSLVGAKGLGELAGIGWAHSDRHTRRGRRAAGRRPQDRDAGPGCLRGEDLQRGRDAAASRPGYDDATAGGSQVDGNRVARVATERERNRRGRRLVPLHVLNISTNSRFYQSYYKK